MQSHNVTLVSNSLPIGEKRETNGNEKGNGQETKVAFLCRNGNETETNPGNESRLYGALFSIKRGHPTPRGNQYSKAKVSARYVALSPFLREMRLTRFRKL